jgi:hypothetical protein
MQGMKKMFMNQMDMNKRMMNIFNMLNLIKMKGKILMFYYIQMKMVLIQCKRLMYDL